MTWWRVALRNAVRMAGGSLTRWMNATEREELSKRVAFLSATADIAVGAIIEPLVSLAWKTRIEPGATVGALARLSDTWVGAGAIIGAGAQIWKAHICPGTIIRRGAWIGSRPVGNRAGMVIVTADDPVEVRPSTDGVFTAGTLDGQRVICAGCHTFTLDEARAHWGSPDYPGGPTAGAEALAIVERLIGESKKREDV